MPTNRTSKTAFFATFGIVTAAFVAATSRGAALPTKHSEQLIVDANDVCEIGRHFSYAVTSCTPLSVHFSVTKEPDGTPACVIRTYDWEILKDPTREITLHPGRLSKDDLLTLMGENYKPSPQVIKCLHSLKTPQTQPEQITSAPR